MSDPVAPDPTQSRTPGKETAGEATPGEATPGGAAPGDTASGGAAPGGAAPAEPVPRDPLLGKIIVRIIVALAIGVSVFALKAYLFGDRATQAHTGDCIDSTETTSGSETRAKIVDCSSPAADFTVAGRVDGETDAHTTACDQFFAEGEEFLIYSSTGGGGYLLCLRPKS